VVIVVARVVVDNFVDITRIAYDDLTKSAEDGGSLPRAVQSSWRCAMICRQNAIRGSIIDRVCADRFHRGRSRSKHSRNVIIADT
jgi:hypothetical protein